MNKTNYTSIGFGLLACLIWGLIFVVPGFMGEFSSFEVVLGRYFFYGLLSLIFFLRGGLKRHPLNFWARAFGFTLIASVGYYTCLVLALRYATPPITALVLGLCPIPITFYGNWKTKNYNYKKLLFPTLLLFLGLILVNGPHFIHCAAPLVFACGLIAALLSFASFTWYAIVNAEFLKENREISSHDWSTMMGLANLVWVIILAAIFSFIYKGTPVLEKYLSFNEPLQRFILGSMVLGCLCSWVGGFLWNKASRSLSIALAGQILIFETVFGLLFVYCITKQLPPFLELCGIGLLLIAVSYGVHLTSGEGAPTEGVP